MFAVELNIELCKRLGKALNGSTFIMVQSVVWRRGEKQDAKYVPLKEMFAKKICSDPPSQSERRECASHMCFFIIQNFKLTCPRTKLYRSL